MNSTPTNKKKGFSESTLREELAKKLSAPSKPSNTLQEKSTSQEPTNNDWIQYKEAMDYLLSSKNMGIVRYGSNYGLDNQEDAYRKFLQEHRQDVYDIQDWMNNTPGQVNSSSHSSSDGQDSFNDVQDDDSSSINPTNNEEQQDEVKIEQLHDLDRQQQEALSWINQEVSSKKQKLDSWLEKRKHELQHGPSQTRRIVLWVVFGLCYLIDATIGSIPFGDVFSFSIILVIWAFMALFFGFGIFMHAIFFYLGDFIIGGDFIPVGGWIIDWAYEPALALTKLSPPRYYIAKYKKEVREVFS